MWQFYDHTRHTRSCCQLTGLWTYRKLLLLQMATPAVDWAESPSVFRCLQEETSILAAKVFVDHNWASEAVIQQQNKLAFFFSAWLLGFRRLHLLQTYRNIIKQIYLFECVLLAIWRNQTQHPEQSKGRQAFRFVLVCSSGIKQPYLISAKSSGYSHQILAEFVFVLGDNGWTVYSF